jgi:predicted histidine transporter YuiF (NhaC family)
VACVITFGLTATYMLLPVGFGGIFLNNILAKNLIDNGVAVEFSQLPLAMAIPVLGMFIGRIWCSWKCRFKYKSSNKNLC